MVRADHAIFSTYGFWLPNDPRGSWSDFVRSWQLFKFGSATQTTSRQSPTGKRHNAGRRRAAKSALRYPAVRFNGVQARACARGFATAVERSGYTVYACSILPDHVHLVVARHRQRAEQIVAQLKGAGPSELFGKGCIHSERLAWGTTRFPFPGREVAGRCSSIRMPTFAARYGVSRKTLSRRGNAGSGGGL